MKARNLSHRLTAVVTFSLGLGITVVCSGLFQFQKTEETTSEVIGVLSPARQMSLRYQSGDDVDGYPVEERSDNLMAVMQPVRASVTEPVKLYSVNEDLIEGNCGTIIISVDESRRVSLNDEEIGTLARFSEVTDRLKDIFDNRARRGVISWAMQSRTDLPEEERIYKTVLVKPAPSLSYGEVVKIIEMIKGTGARPIALYTHYSTSW